MAFAVNSPELAMPFASVVAVFMPPWKAPLAPVTGGANVTTTPLAGAPPVVTATTRGAANAALIAAV